MDQLTEKDLFIKVMDAHRLVVEESSNGLTIKKSKYKNKTLQTYLVLSIAGVIIGISSLLYGSRLLAKILIAVSSSFLVITINLKERERTAEKKSIKVDHKIIEIREGYKGRKVKTEDVAEFRTKVEQHHSLYVGTISIITDHQMCFEFLEIFGEDEALLQEDLAIISNYIVDRYLSN